MADRSTIEWTQATWNPVTGCDKVSPGCARCYDHRSRDLHGGIPFPGPLLQPAAGDSDGVPFEAFPALAASGGGGSWPAARMPIHLHVFAHIVGGALRNCGGNSASPRLPPDDG